MKTSQLFGSFQHVQPEYEGNLVAAQEPHYYSSDHCLLGDDDTLISSLGPDSFPTKLVPALIIDSDQESRFYLRARLAIAGVLQADEAATGSEALNLLQLGNYRIVLLNLDLPDMDGWFLASKVIPTKPQPTLSSKLVLTGASMSWFSQARARFTGVCGCLRKPLDPVEVALLFRRLQA
jgi:CheY-like chemotaxis protein